MKYLIVKSNQQESFGGEADQNSTNQSSQRPFSAQQVLTGQAS